MLGAMKINLDSLSSKNKKLLSHQKEVRSKIRESTPNYVSPDSCCSVGLWKAENFIVFQKKNNLPSHRTQNQRGVLSLSAWCFYLIYN